MVYYCRVCGTTKNLREEPRFLYVYCPLHSNVPPAYLDVAKETFLKTGKTAWDASLEEQKDNEILGMPIIQD